MATAQNTLSIVSANKTAKTAKTATKTAKPANKTAKTAKPAKEWDNAIITRIASGVIAVAKAEELREKLAADIKEFRSYGVKLGASRRTCAMSQEFYAAFLAQGVAEKTATNYLSCLRESINNGRAFSLNQSRDAKKAKSKKSVAGTTWKNPGEVMEALAVAINNVKTKAGTQLWERAMSMTPDGFDLAIADFLEAQATESDAA